MKVLLLADSLANGGLERQLSLLATNLPLDWEPRVWTMAGGPFEAYLRSRGVTAKVQERHFRRDPLPAWALYQELRSWRPDVVHAWGWMSAVAATSSCRALRIPLVNGLIRKGAMDVHHRWLESLGLAMATLVVANTQAGLEAWGVSPAKGRVVYNGFDPSRLDIDLEHHAPDAAPFTVVMTARMSLQKDYDVVIEAARRLSGGGKEWRFLLVGDGPDRERLRHAAHDLVERGVVVFPKPGTEVLGIVRDADVGVLMSNPRLHREGLSNSIMEYMALGLPVVCGDGGGNPELVADGVTGFIVPQDDPACLAERLAYLRDQREECAIMGAAGRARVLSEFSVGAMVDAMLAVYAEAAALTKGRRHGQGRPTLRG